MASEIVTILSLETGKSVKNIAELKANIAAYKDQLKDTNITYEEQRTILKALDENQRALRGAMFASCETMEQVVDQAKGLDTSYNSLVNQMAELKKQWRATTDEAERADLGARINDINDQLKEMDASVGNYQRNVGNYTNSVADALKGTFDALEKDNNSTLGKMSKSLKELIPAVKNVGKAFRTAETDATIAGKGINKALISTGIGALLPLIGTLVNQFDHLRTLFGDHTTETEKLKEATDALTDSFHRMDLELELQNKLLEANGASKEELRLRTIDNITSEMELAQAQIDEAEATLAQLKAHGWLRKLFTGEKDDIKTLEEEIEKLKDKEQSLYEQRLKLTTDNVAEETKARNKAAEESAKAAEEEYNKRQEFEQRVTDMLDKEREQRNEKLKTRDQEAMANALVIAEQMKASVTESNEYQREQDEQAAAYHQMIEEQKVIATKNGLNAMMSLMVAFSGENAKQTKAYKALATAQAIIDTYKAANEAYASLASIPVVGAGLGAAAAAAAIAAGMANVRAINSVSLNGASSAASASTAMQSIISSPAVIQQVQTTRTLTSASEEERLNKMASDQRVYVVYSDIEGAGNKVAVTNNETTF